MRDTLYEVHVREKYGLPAAWKAYRFEILPHSQSAKAWIQLTGIVAPAKTRGARKGDPNWGKGDPSTRQVLTIAVVEHDEWLRGWENKTGKCHSCQGEGKELASCGIHGTTYRTCYRCGGTGWKPIISK